MTRDDTDLHAAVIRARPDLAEAPFTVLTGSWHSTAIDVDDRVIFKFPRHDAARRALLKEAALLAAIRPHLAMAVPAMTIEPGPPMFSCHAKLPGRHLLAADYARLGEPARHRLGRDLGLFYAQLHRLDTRLLPASVEPVAPWQSLDRVRQKALPALSRDLRSAAREVVEGYARLPPDPHGTTFGFFDGHGWNMAFDHDRGCLAGIYDFADAGIGPLHQDLIYSNFISPDLTERVVSAYEALTATTIDRHRIAMLTAMHRLSELAELADDPDHVQAMIGHFADWMAVWSR